MATFSVRMDKQPSFILWFQVRNRFRRRCFAVRSVTHTKLQNKKYKKNDTASILLLLLFKYAYTREKKISQDQPDVNDDEKHVTVT